MCFKQVYAQLVGILSSVLLRKADEQSFALKCVLPVDM